MTGLIEARGHERFARYYEKMMEWIGEYTSIVESYEVKFPRRDEKVASGITTIEFILSISMKNGYKTWLFGEITTYDEQILVVPRESYRFRYSKVKGDVVSDNLGREGIVGSPDEYVRDLELIRRDDIFKKRTLN